MKLILRGAAAGLAIATLAVAGSASAATTASADATAQILTALSVTVDATASTLDFGQLADGGISAPVNLTVKPDGTAGACPLSVVCSGAVKAPNFNVQGLGGKLVGISFVNATETLSYTGTPPTGFLSTMNVGSFKTSAVANQVTLSGTGAASFTVGGTLTMSRNQAPGTYAGTVSVNVAYN